MRFAAALALAIALAAGCARDPDEALKPHLMLEKATALLEAGSPETGKVAQKALDKAVRAELGIVDMREYAWVLFQHRALAGDLPGAEKAFERVHPPSEAYYVHLPAANNLAVLYHRAGRMPDALRIARKTVLSASSTSQHRDDRAERVAILANMDRIATAAGESALPEEAHGHLVNFLMAITQSRYGRALPLEPGLRDWLGRYRSYLEAGGRASQAARVAEQVGWIEARAPSSAETPDCVTQASPRRLTCILEAK